MNFKIKFELDGAGIMYDPYEPIHLDSLLAWVLAPIHSVNADITRDDKPDYVPLPLMKKTLKKQWVWQASALIPEGHTIESIKYIRKRLRENRIEITEGSPNMKMGVYRGYNIPLPLLCCHKMVAYANGNRKSVKKLLKQIKYLGKKRTSRVINIETEQINENWSMIKDGKAMRWLPDKKGNRFIRLQPPYWNNYNRVNCCEVGDLYAYNNLQR